MDISGLLTRRHEGFDAQLVGMECLLGAPRFDASQLEFRNWRETLPGRGGRTLTGSGPDP